ncbi:MAG: hypothetical protein ACYC4L_04585 [Chloroflexota bacterium]
MSEWLGLGVHASNRQHPSDDDYRQLALARPEVMPVMGHHGRAVYDRLEELAADWPRRPLYLCRVGEGRQDCAGAVNDYRRARAQVPEQVLAEGRWWARYGNEPNHLEEGWPQDPQGYAECLRAVAGVCTEPLGLANLTLGRLGEAGCKVAMDWQDYLAGLMQAGALACCQWVALSLYGDTADPEQLLPYYTLGQRLIAVEYGVPWYRGADRAQWWLWRGRQLQSAGLEGLCVFICGGEANGAWPAEYILTDDEARSVVEVAAELRRPF